MKKLNVFAKLFNAFLLYGGSILGAIFRYDWVKKKHIIVKKEVRKNY